jgi:hypothetical protein
MRGILAFFLAMLLAGCAAIPPPSACAPGAVGPSIWLVDRGWHTELLVPADAISGPLAMATGRFPTATLIAFGFGKRDWITAEVQDLRTILAGPIPGPGVVEVTGRAALPANAIRLPVGGGMAGLLNFLSTSLADPAAVPAVTSRFGQHFHDSSRGYSLAYTCNTWVAEALAAARLPVRAAGVVRTRGVLAQASALPRACLS